MAFRATAFNLALIAAALASLPVGYVAWRRRETPGARPLAAMMFAVVIWAGAVLFSQVATGRAGTVFWMKFTYAGIVTAVLSWFFFAIEYTGRDGWLTRGTFLALLVEPVGVNLLVWTTELHGLVWTATGAGGPIVAAPARPAGYEIAGHGAAFWLHTVYSYLLITVGMALLLGRVYRDHDVYRAQAAAIVLAVGMPWTMNVIYFSDVTQVDITPAGFAVSGLAFLFATFRFELTDLTPIARDTVVDNIRDGVFVVDRQDRVVDVNPMAKHILGVDDERVVGKHAQRLLSQYPGLYERYEGVGQVQEEIGLDDGGERRYFHVRVSPLYDSRDRRAGRLFMVHDITDQKSRQQELQRQNERLDQFASLVSHDLRNPLNVADGYVELAKDTGDTSYLDKVEDSHERMGQLIDDVLTLARQGKTITETEPVDLEETAAEAWSNVDTAEATLEVRGDGRFVANRGRLLRAFENLFRNAVEHGGEAVTVRVGTLGSESGVSLRLPEERGFYLEDDGPGIPEDQRDEVLEDGFTTESDGTGLGLSIVTSIVEAHGWEIAVAEGSDGGARFEVTGVEPVDADAAARTARADGG